VSPPTAATYPRFTDEQRRAVSTRGVSVSLSAGAGCGKTTVLTERFLSHFEPGQPDAVRPEDIGQLVAITFTDRAAREMRDRIRQKCYQRLQAAASEDAAYWVALLRALDHARISTIHSFCAALLRSRAVEAGVDPRFTVLEQAQADTLLSEAIDDEVRRLVSRRDETTLDLAVRFNIDGLRDRIRTFVLEGTPDDFNQWLGVSPDEQVARWAAWFAELPPRLAREFAESAPALAVREVLNANVPTNKTMRERRAILLETLDALRAEPARLDELARLLDVVVDHSRVQGAGRADAWPHPEAYEVFKEQASRLRDLARSLRPLAGFVAADARDAAVVGRQLLAVANQARAAYALRKAELGVMDFNDLLARTRALLADERHRGVVEQLSRGLTLVLVDEFQDTDPVQVELVEALCGGLGAGKLFFVGDHKQSIYRFRGADPHVFRKLRAGTSAEGRQSLSLNFRSQPAILDFVNALFCDDLGDDYEPLRADREQVSPVPAVEFFWAPGQPGNRQKVDELRTREADWLARRIRGMLDGGERIVWDADTAATRAARQGDIAVLFRALSNVELYEAALERYGIDYYLVGGHAFYAQQEIYDLLNLLRTLNDPADPVSLVGVLRSGFFSLADETIFWLAQHYGGIAGGLFAEKLPESISPEQAERVAAAARTIRRLRACKDRMRICELIELALDLTGYDAALLNEFLGERKLANLLKLQEQARSLERGNLLGLADFITQLAQFVVHQPDEPLAATHSEDTDVVRLMTVHQAKGLEFPVVIVPDVDRRRFDSPGDVRFDGRLGPLVKLEPRGAHSPAPSGFDLWRYLEDAEDAAESKRLLYVATTRAADRLILSGAVNTVGDTNGPWTELLASRFELATGRFIGRLPQDARPPAIQVITQQPAVDGAKSRRRAKADVAAMLAEVESRAAAPPATPRAIHTIEPDPAARRQYSFSRLSGALHRKYERLDMGELTGEASADPRSLGTLVHAALAVIDPAAPGDVRALVERLADDHLPDNPAEAAEAVAMVERFVRSRRAAELAAAPTCHAEVEFLLAWPPGSQQPGDVVLRGFIDRLYQDSTGRWHVVDFKTNRVDDEGVAAASAPYEMQMLVYGLAAEEILGSPPVSLTLHFLRTGSEHQFAWNDDARARVIAMVNDAIGADRQGPVAPAPSEPRRPRKQRQLKLELD
jgi:ATP-dependent helicase/nuclease subunit A